MLIGIKSTKQIPSLSMQPMPLFELYKWRPSGRGTLLPHADPQNLSPRDPVACLQRDLGLFLGDLLHGLNVFQTHSNVPALETTAHFLARPNLMLGGDNHLLPSVCLVSSDNVYCEVLGRILSEL
jgi:hypothetical protein